MQSQDERLDIKHYKMTRCQLLCCCRCCCAAAHQLHNMSRYNYGGLAASTPEKPCNATRSIALCCSCTLNPAA